MRMFLMTLSLLAVAAIASADDRILLAEVLPALADTELGALDMGEAPAPGSHRIVRRHEVIAALRGVGRSAEGLAIPRATTVRREVRSLDPQVFRSLATDAVNESIFPCVVDELNLPQRVSVGLAAPEVRASVRAPSTGSRASGILILSAGGREQKVAVAATVRCPPPVVQPGSRIRLVVTVGSVRASAPGEARQAGRVGDVIRVHNHATQAQMQARVLDAQTAEVLR
jgi:hypothetical protein